MRIEQQMERMIAERIINDAIALGFSIDVNDGEETVVEHCNDAPTILSAMFSTDEDCLILRKGEIKGWVRFVYGNDGWDVVNDYTTNLSNLGVMEGYEKLSNALEKGEFTISVK